MIYTPGVTPYTVTFSSDVQFQIARLGTSYKF